jgi:hypothetical protein
MIRELLPAQTHDPARGSFMVNPLPVRGKRHRGEPVYRAAHHLRGIGQPEPHPYAIDFVIVQEKAA